MLQPKQIQQIISRPLFFPFFLLLISLFAFSLLIPRLGFYWDDWPVIFMAKHGDFSIMQAFYLYDRPFYIIPYLFTIPVLGLNPQIWQMFALLLQFCAALTIWLVLRRIWPNRKLLAEEAALLFLVYPSFTQQSISVTYVQHFFAYTMLFLSFWFTSKAIQQPEKYMIFTLLALITGAWNLFTLEYFTGLELIRPMMLFILIRRQAIPIAQSWRKALLHWIPYMLLLLMFVIWRVVFANIPEDPNQLTLLSSFAASPAHTAISFVQDVLKQFVFILFSVWQMTLNPGLIDLNDMSLLFSWGIAIFSGFCVAVYFFVKIRSVGQDEAERRDWGLQTIGFGALAVFLSMLPVQLIQKNVFSGLFAERFTLPALFGAAICWVGIGKLALKSGSHRAMLIAILVGLAVGTQIRVSHAYTLDWQKQTRIYWQLFWRSEKIEPNTPLIFSDALSGYVSEYSASAAINALYDSPIDNGRVNYWVFDYFDNFDGPKDFIAGVQVGARLRNLSFQGSLNDAVFIHASQNQCVWVLDSSYVNNPDVPAGFRDAAEFSNLSSLQSSEGNRQLPDRNIFGDEPVHDWCYFFQKMDQAKQIANWARILALWSEAQQKGYGPNNQFELLPVLEALQKTNRWPEALDLSKEMVRRQLNTKATLCSAWREEPPDIYPAAFQPELEEFLQDSGC